MGWLKAFVWNSVLLLQEILHITCTRDVPPLFGVTFINFFAYQKKKCTYGRMHSDVQGADNDCKIEK